MMQNHGFAPELFWISGSAPSWRVMLALEAKAIPFVSRRLDSAKAEHKTPEFLALNPRGQVPLLRHGAVAVRESLAILAYLDRQWQESPIFGETPAQAARIWQAIIDFESNVQPALAETARILFRGQAQLRSAELAGLAHILVRELKSVDSALQDGPFVAGDFASAADFALYPSLAWLGRAVGNAGSGTPAEGVSDGLEHIARWQGEIERLPYFPGTYPPHWGKAPSA